jgi:tetratricopeptide (TPR) repeat protein
MERDFSFRRVLIFLAGLAVLSSHSLWAWAEPPPDFQAADSAYEKGDCFAAINLYREAVSAFHLSKEERLHALQNTAFCHLEIDDAANAVVGLRSFLSAVPDDQESRIRLVRALYQLHRYRDAREEAARVTDPAYLEEAWLTSAVSSIELEEPLAAVDLLDHVEASPEMRPALDYWKGVARFHNRDYPEARDAFQQAIGEAPKDHWVHSAAKTWMNQIDAAIQRLHGDFALGWIFDNNVAQRTLVTLGPGGVPATPTPNDATYIKDRAFWVSMDLTYLFLYHRYLQIGLETEASGPFYQNHPAYDDQNLSASAYANFSIAPQTSVGATIKYWDNRYKFNYYQNFFVVDPYVNWTPGEKWTFHADLGYTFYLDTSVGRLFSPVVSARYQWKEGLAPFFSAFYTRARGQKAIYLPGSPEIVASGTAFSRYISRGLTAGAEVELLDELTVTTELTRSWTNYDHEYLPPNPPPPRLDRGDDAWIYYLQLYHPFGKSGIYSSGAVTYTENHSHGFQDVPGNNPRNDYNYERWYILLTLGVKF